MFQLHNIRLPVMKLLPTKYFQDSDSCPTAEHAITEYIMSYAGPHSHTACPGIAPFFMLQEPLLIQIAELGSGTKLLLLCFWSYYFLFRATANTVHVDWKS
jgi:hypothetical protein